jgi:hypothetical protein
MLRDATFRVLLGAAAPLLLTWLAGCGPSRPEIVSVPAFCYQTLADVDCYLRPDQGRESQLVGVHLWREGDPALANYWLERAREAEAAGEPRIIAEDFEIEALGGGKPPDGCDGSITCRTISGASKLVSVVTDPVSLALDMIW